MKKHTKEKYTIHDSGRTLDIIKEHEDDYDIIAEIYKHRGKRVYKSDAKVMIQALNIKNETGLLPLELKEQSYQWEIKAKSVKELLRQSMEQNEKMWKALESATKKIEKVINGTPTGDNRNLLTEINISILESLNPIDK